MKDFIFIIAVFMVTNSTAYATDCVYDGNTYSPGSKAGSFVCQPDGTWQPE